MINITQKQANDLFDSLEDLIYLCDEYNLAFNEVSYAKGLINKICENNDMDYHYDIDEDEDY